MTPKHLANINTIVRKMIIDHLNKTGISENQFSKQCGIQQNQLWLYLHSGNDKKGLHSGTLQKIGEYLLKNS
jgi:hypothetical protein